MNNKKEHYTEKIDTSNFDNLSIDKELDSFFRKSSNNNLLNNQNLDKKQFTKLESKTQSIPISIDISNSKKNNKKPVVVIKSLPKENEVISKKPVVIIKKNISKLYDEEPIVKKPVVNIVRQKGKNENNLDLVPKIEKEKSIPLNINFDEPPTKEQIKRSSVKIKGLKNKTIEYNKEFESSRNKFDWTQKSSLIDVDGFEELKHIESLDDISNDENVKNNNNNLNKFNIGTQIDKLYKNHNFEALILDSIDKKINTTSFRTNILKKLNMTINAGDLVVVYGLPHSGKTTLLNIISKKEFFNKGEYIIRDKIHGELSEAQANHFIENNLFFVYKTLSIESNNPIAYYFEILYNKTSKEFKEYISFQSLVDKFNIENLMTKTFLELSPIEKQVILIIYAILKEVSIIIIDEPISYEMNEKDYIIKNVLKIAKSFFNKTIILVTTNKNLFDIASKIYYLIKGSARLI